MSAYDRVMTGLLGAPSDYGGILTAQDRSTAQGDARMALAAQLLASGGWHDRPVTFGQAAGGAIAAGRQAQNESLNNALKAQLMRSQISKNLRDDSDLPTSVREYQFAKANGYKGTFDEWQRIGTVQAKDPASIQEYDLAKSQGYQGTFEQWLKDRAEATVTMPYVPMTVAGVPGFGNRTDASFTPTSTLPSETDAAARLKEAEARAAELAKAQAGRDATFQEDLAVIDDEILRTQRLLSEFQSGKYQTGPMAGRLPNFRTAAQDLQREQGKDVIKAISSATFGALSEGERGFLRELGISETSTEESNINMLNERLEKLQRTKQRLMNRSRLGVGPDAAPVEVGQTTTVNGVKITRKK